MMSRAVLPLTALLLTIVACDSKSEKDQSSDSASTSEGSTGDSESEGGSTAGGSTEGGSATEGSATEGTSTGPGPEAISCTEETLRKGRACAGGGTQYCLTDWNPEDQKYFWGVCVAAPICTPDEMDGCNWCQLDGEGTPGWVDTCGGTQGEESTTPLVLKFDAEPVRFDMRAAAFDLGPQCGATDWPGAATPWLALDRDGSGAIEGGHELFGSATRLASGGVAEHGFVALAELDADHDGRISASDPEFARLLLWADHDADRRSVGWELAPAGDSGLIAIELSYVRDARCDARGNCEVERASFIYRDALGRERSGEVVDVHLACQ
jgi:hypothetical protein